VERIGTVMTKIGRPANWPMLLLRGGPGLAAKSTTMVELLNLPIPTASPFALKTEASVGLPKTVGSSEMETEPAPISEGFVAKTLICAHPAGGAVSFEI